MTSYKDLAKYIGKSGTWTFTSHGDQRVRIPVTIFNAKAEFGKIRLEISYNPDEPHIWIDSDSVRIDWDAGCREAHWANNMEAM